MLIPEFNPKNGGGHLSLITLSTLEEFQNLRKQTTDKLIIILFTAEWDESSTLLGQMVAQMPGNFDYIKFATVDADQATPLVEHFKIDAVPAVVLLHPHKTNGDIFQQDITPEWLTTTVT